MFRCYINKVINIIITALLSPCPYSPHMFGPGKTVEVILGYSATKTLMEKLVHERASVSVCVFSVLRM